MQVDIRPEQLSCVLGTDYVTRLYFGIRISDSNCQIIFAELLCSWKRKCCGYITPQAPSFALINNTSETRNQNNQHDIFPSEIMSLPFVFPSTSGPGRFTEVASFKKSSKNSTVVSPHTNSPTGRTSVLTTSQLQESVDSAMHATSSFPPFRHCRLGDSASLNGDQNTLLISDWTSPDEKKSFEGQSGSESPFA